MMHTLAGDILSPLPCKYFASCKNLLGRSLHSQFLFKFTVRRKSRHGVTGISLFPFAFWGARHGVLRTDLWLAGMHEHQTYARLFPFLLCCYHLTIVFSSFSVCIFSMRARCRMKKGRCDEWDSSMKLSESLYIDSNVGGRSGRCR